jgi:chromosome partitioning protein
MALVVAFLNTKGGVGKSTLAAHFAIELFDRGIATSLVDADPQGTAINHVQSAEPDLRCQTATKLEQIDAAIEELSAHHQVVVLDSPGKTGEAVTVISFLCDVAIIPLQPSTADVLASSPVLGLIKASQRSRGGKPLPWIVLNLTRKNDVVAKRYRHDHQERSTIPIAKTQIRRLDDYRDAYGLATVATRQKADSYGAGTDIRNLIDEVLGQQLVELTVSTMRTVNG